MSTFDKIMIVVQVILVVYWVLDYLSKK